MAWMTEQGVLPDGEEILAADARAAGGGKGRWLERFPALASLKGAPVREFLAQMRASERTGGADEEDEGPGTG